MLICIINIPLTVHNKGEGVQLHIKRRRYTRGGFFIFILLSDALDTRYGCAIFQSPFHGVTSTTKQFLFLYVARFCSFYLEIFPKPRLIAFSYPHFFFPLQIHTSIRSSDSFSTVAEEVGIWRNSLQKKKMCCHTKKMFFTLKIWS